MKPAARRQILARAAVVLFGLLAGASVLAQSSGPRRESVIVGSSAAAARQVATILGLAQVQNWDRALDVLQELDDPQRGLVEVEDRRAVSADLVAQILRRNLPDEALATYQKRVGLQAQAWLEEGRLLADPRPLRRILDELAGSAAAGEATRALAELAWQADQLDEAAAWWSLLDRDIDAAALDPAAPLRIATTPSSQTEAAAWAVLVELYSGDIHRGDELLLRFTEQFPDAHGWIAGRSQPLGEALRRIRRSEFNDQNKRPAPLQVGAPVWRIAWNDSQVAGRLTETPMLGPSIGTVLPSASDGRLFWQDDAAIRAVRIDDGRPVWPLGAGDAENTVYRFAPDRPYPYEMPFLGDLRRAVAIAGDRLVAVTGPQFSIEAPREPRPIESRLVCLDIGSREGRLVWTKHPHEVLPDGAWRFSGVPQLVGSRVFIAARRSNPTVEIGIACLDLDSGELLWFQPVTGLLMQSPTTHHLVTCDIITPAWGFVYLAGDFGAVACLSEETGAIRWVRRDPALPWRLSASPWRAESPARECRFHRGQVFSIEHNDCTVQSLDAWTGGRSWRTTVDSKLSHLAGVRGGIVVAAGDKLWGLDQDSGAVRWQHGFDDVEGAFVGRTVIVGNDVFACTHDELWQIDLLTGEPIDRVPLWNGYGIQGGHLLLAGENLVVASREELVALHVQR